MYEPHLISTGQLKKNCSKDTIACIILLTVFTNDCCSNILVPVSVSKILLFTETGFIKFVCTCALSLLIMVKGKTGNKDIP